MGLHPRFVIGSPNQGHLLEVEELLQEARVVGLGEIGPDFNNRDIGHQQKVYQQPTLELLLHFAVQHGLPVVIRLSGGAAAAATGECTRTTKDIMKRTLPMENPVHMHCLS